MKFSAGIQKILPFGYLFLVALGILKESLFYYQIGINILHYSTVMDVLISPVADLTAHPAVLIGVLVLILYSYFFPVLMVRWQHKPWGRILLGMKQQENLTGAQLTEKLTNLFATLMGVTMFTFFLGIGYGEGKKQAAHIKSGSVKYDRTLNFNSGETERVSIIGSNSIYYFYLNKGSKVIKIAPVGTIKSIELTENKMIP